MNLKIRIASFISKILPDKLYLKSMVFIKSGEVINFKRPLTMNAKLQWKKIYAFEPIHSIIADKIAVRDFVEEKIGKEYLIPILQIYDDVDDINVEKLPKSFVMKSNNGSGTVKVVENKEDFNNMELIFLAKKWIKNDYYSWTKEPQYKKIQTKIFIEEFLQDEKGKVPYDYKFHCFSGTVKYINVDVDRYSEHKRGFFDREWNYLNFNWGSSSLKPIAKIEKPEKLNKMIEIAEHLSNGFDYLRVDLYIIENKIYFGELTLHPTSGFKRFYPNEYNRVWGKLINEPKG